MPARPEGVNDSTPLATRSPASVLRTALCATSSLVTSELDVCGLSASGRTDHDDIDEPLRVLLAATCLRRKTKSLQGIPDTGLAITVNPYFVGRSGAAGRVDADRAPWRGWQVRTQGSSRSGVAAAPPAVQGRMRSVHPATGGIEHAGHGIEEARSQPYDVILPDVASCPKSRLLTRRRGVP